VTRQGPTGRGYGCKNTRQLLLTALTVLALALPAAASASGPAYVSMGDSYTSGPGLRPSSPGAPEGCGQSTIDYPHLVAAALELSLDDVSCGGASRLNFTNAQFTGQPPQFDALAATTQVVSVGMGGNDNGFFGRLYNGCTETDSGDERNRGAPCKHTYGQAEAGAIKEDKRPYTEVLAEIHELAPGAKVFVLGYPEITPQAGICFQSLPWTSADNRWVASLEQKLNKMLAKAAKADGYTYVDTFTSSAGHDMCQPFDARWVEPLNGVVEGIAVHPNAAGMEADARALEQAMTAAGVG
jgi:hypothetical protein